ncbi:hypothetical protein BJV85_001094 [Clostridium acetobutylicum]|uniref:Uncharacterized conserved protein, similar to lppY/lpqO of M.tuberculosis n=1 Tax=Clostridium acetobutylicum (strain ATCC 824 / DSM 792 / JCM 1419 / IAM 19013 / LMG 5710 / NBRC 13948 / NRRL B-527 / VKM B-1787 / 2291 / W) TaxID=272562 RepID=Q97FE1_CLOAB|nr:MULTISPECIES: DUF1259 domain-containing protein [Clostridium]AAK80743.1 Uncharacterized conserved protein, similar to lppY/lpqO of M.tuberculosis [Clostridium acetobutylicum ATCC 824]ADZ21844.1 Conserved hypothetical protein [Clostridium acetobutylicum EA 2018]AEI32557.1 hypothetical protein SMB_G2835 [Clostridium acetobutylicum DSM 1731]AWV78843.1 DUF1259 domain-containing protein [Clostridium acetobutylicum]MBC2395080.1 DUF1259 domain-containing protein [Clostridium acetobutylicum]
MYIPEDQNFCPYMREDIDVDTRQQNQNLCSQFANILGAKVTESKPRSCSVERDRENLRITIMGKPLTTVVKAEFSYQSLDASGRALNVGEVAVLQEEVNRFITVLRRNGIDVTAIHNHWLYDTPKLIYVHLQSIERPLEFARKVAEALRVLR